MPAVQFYGSGAVLQAAENRECPNWAIFQGKQFLFKYEGGDMAGSADLLAQILESLKHSAAVYTLQFYEDAEKIKANTPHDGSFNFKMIEEHERPAHGYQGGAVMQKLEAIETRLQQIEEEEEEPGGLNGIITNLLNDPDKIVPLVQGLAAVGGLIKGAFMPQQPGPAVINGVPDDRLNKAIETLKKNDPKITEHLEKLAAMSETNKNTFNYLVKMLDNF